MQRGAGGTGRRPWASQAGGHPKIEITNLEMLYLDDYSYCKSTNT